MARSRNIASHGNHGRLAADPLVSPKCQSGQAQKSLKIGTIRDITLIASVKPIYSSLKKKYLKHRLYFSANRRDNFAVKQGQFRTYFTVITKYVTINFFSDSEN